MLRPLVLVPALASLTGCVLVIDEPLAPFDDAPVFLDDASQRQGGRDGVVRGDLGPVRDFEGRTDDVIVHGDGWWTSVEVSTWDDDGRWGMVLVELEGDLRALPSGTYRYDADEGTAVGPTTVTGVSVVGCSSNAGDEVGYDALADDGVIVVDNDGDDCVVEVRAELPDDRGVTASASASFRLQ